MSHNIRRRSRSPEELAKGRDLTADGHRRCWLALLAPFDELAPGLAAFMYRFDSSPQGWRPYPDTREVLEELQRKRIRVGVVSDTGWNIRTVFAAFGLDHLIDSFDLSYEHAICKPDPRIFRSACSKLATQAEDTLMVGDTYLTDGGAANIGITTLILPERDRAALPALDQVLALTG